MKDHKERFEFLKKLTEEPNEENVERFAKDSEELTTEITKDLLQYIGSITEFSSIYIQIAMKKAMDSIAREFPESSIVVAKFMMNELIGELLDSEGEENE